MIGKVRKIGHADHQGDLSFPSRFGSTKPTSRCSSAAAATPDKVFAFLVNASGALVLYVYLLIVLAQIRLRRQRERRKSGRPRRGVNERYFFVREDDFCRSASSTMRYARLIELRRVSRLPT